MIAAARQRMHRVVKLVAVLAPRELRVRYRQSFLDIAWALLTPVVILVVYGVVLTQSFGVSGTCAPYLTSAWTGLVLWTFFATSLGGAVTSLIGSADLVTKLYFPHEAMPLSMTGVALADLSVGLATLLPLALIQGVHLGWTGLLIVVPLAVLVVWTAATGIVVGVLATFFRDMVHAVQLLIRVGIFAVPVMYEVSALPRPFAWSASWNPVAVAITQTRTALLCGRLPDFGLLALHGAAGVLLLVGAILYTRGVESRIADVI